MEMYCKVTVSEIIQYYKKKKGKEINRTEPKAQEKKIHTFIHIILGYDK